ncbi:uncharacterized protein LOC141616868 [Silene latifolia]|uniref:uncharacterized protein LOC141616868 n=1 Tax=Silene latifolia TaxID=37657 RepID=UPI003D76E42E
MDSSHLYERLALAYLFSFCWHWRKVCQVRDIIKAGFVDEFWSIGNGDYAVSGCYNWLREKRMQMEWYKSIWNTIAPPKHSFMAWLIANQALRLKDRLFCYNVASDDLCCICAFNPETHEHLFQECLYAQQVLKIVLCRLGTHLQGCDILKQIARRRWTSGRKHVTTTAILAVWYMIWMQRNSARLTYQVTSPWVLAEQILNSVRSRIHVCKSKSFSIRDRLWLSKVHML